MKQVIKMNSVGTLNKLYTIDNVLGSIASLICTLVIADAVIFVVLTLMNIPLPSWAYPFIFYIQVSHLSLSHVFYIMLFYAACSNSGTLLST